MSEEKAIEKVHPEGERKSGGMEGPERSGSVDTFAGKVQVKWVAEAAVSSLGLMPYFIEFLKTSGVFDAWVEGSPLKYTSTRISSGIYGSFWRSRSRPGTRR